MSSVSAWEELINKEVEGRLKNFFKLSQNLTPLFQISRINRQKGGASRSCLDRLHLVFGPGMTGSAVKCVSMREVNCCVTIYVFREGELEGESQTELHFSRALAG